MRISAATRRSFIPLRTRRSLYSTQHARLVSALPSKARIAQSRTWAWWPPGKQSNCFLLAQLQSKETLQDASREKFLVEVPRCEWLDHFQTKTRTSKVSSVAGPDKPGSLQGVLLLRPQDSTAMATGLGAWHRRREPDTVGGRVGVRSGEPKVLHVAAW
jgi:hypothetical protein